MYTDRKEGWYIVTTAIKIKSARVLYLQEILNIQNVCSFPVETDACPEIVEPDTIAPVTINMRGYFLLDGEDQSVDGSVSYLLLDSCSSRFRCADLCLRNSSCLSFSYGSDSYLCKLYDADYSLDLVNSTLTNYYIQRST